MRHSGHPLRQATIVEQVWPLDVEMMTKVGDVYVNYLRRKVGAGYGRRLIRTRSTGSLARTIQEKRPKFCDRGASYFSCRLLA